MSSDPEDSDSLCDPTNGNWEANEDELGIYDVPESPLPFRSPVGVDAVVHQSAKELAK